MKKCRKCPYLARYGNRNVPEAQWSWYAVYRENGVDKRKSLATRNERVAQKRFVDLCERLDRGVLGLALRPRRIPFIQAGRCYLADGTVEPSKVSIERHRQNLFWLKTTRDDSGQPSYVEGEGHLTRYFRNRDIKTIGIKDVTGYVRHRQKSGVSSNTILRELATLSAIFQPYLREELVLSNPVLAVKKPKLNLVRSNYRPSDEELARVFASLFPGARRFFPAFCNSGCRLSELRNCNVGNADPKAKALKVRGKGNKVRLVPTNDDLIACIREELAARPGAVETDPLFVNREGKRYRSLRTPLSCACEKAGAPHLLHHSRRHAYATLQHKQGTDLVLLSRLLGHANPTVTQNIYVDPFPEDLRKAAEGFKIDLTQESGRKAATGGFRGRVDRVVPLKY